MSALKQPTDHQARLDNAIKLDLVSIGTRFLYTIDGAGKCYEGTLLEKSPEGHVRLGNSGVWHWPLDVRIEEILSQPEKTEAPKTEVTPKAEEPPRAVTAAAPENPGHSAILSKPGPSPVPLPSAKPTIQTTKPKR